jgi:ATP-dependent RNA helicase RhlE
VTVQNFADLGLPQALVASAAKAGLNVPKPIQVQAIPSQLEGRDVLGIAQTGSGKTAAFGLPILAGLSQMEGRPEPRTTRALILAPTRELAVQIDEALKSFAGTMRLTTALVLGGVSRNAQIQKLAKGVDILIATPGRLRDLVDDHKVRLDGARWVVLDEADRMLDMGFIRDVRHLMSKTSKRRQTCLFSATMPPAVAELAQGLLRDPIRVEAAPQGTTLEEVSQQILLTPTAGKRATLARLLEDPAMDRVIVFTRTKHGADRVAQNLEKDGFEAEAIHGNKSQNARQRALNGFRDGSIRLLVATDIAARGIDVPGVTHVVQYELPDEPETYVHRIGRTGRNGASGAAIALVADEERGKLAAVERLIRKKLLPEGAPKPAPQAGKPQGQRGQQRPGQHRQGQRPQGAKPNGQGSNGQRPQGQRPAAQPSSGGDQPIARHSGQQPQGQPSGQHRQGQPQGQRNGQPHNGQGHHGQPRRDGAQANAAQGEGSRNGRRRRRGRGRGKAQAAPVVA